MPGTTLILGASGRFGRHASAAFAAAGWQVRRFDRGRDRLPEAAEGAQVIVNGWNPPYPDWATQLPGLTERVIGAARASGATILQPANVYVYGAGAPPVLRPDTPHAATNPLGRLRIEMEARLRDSGLPVILLRAGDYIDTEPSGGWLDRVMLKPGKGLLDYPGRPDIPHAWAFLPDMARATVALVEGRADLPRFAEVPFPGYTLTGEELAQGLAEALGHRLRLRRMSWLPLHLARPFWPMARGLLEMRYLWNMPHGIDGSRFGDMLPEFRPTAVQEALQRAVAAAG